MVGSDIAFGVDTSSAPVEHRIEATRLQPAAVADLAGEFSTLLRRIDERKLEGDSAVQLGALLGAFDELVRDMRAASTEIRRLLGDAPQP